MRAKPLENGVWGRQRSTMSEKIGVLKTKKAESLGNKTEVTLTEDLKQ